MARRPKIGTIIGVTRSDGSIRAARVVARDSRYLSGHQERAGYTLVSTDKTSIRRVSIQRSVWTPSRRAGTSLVVGTIIAANGHDASRLRWLEPPPSPSITRVRGRSRRRGGGVLDLFAKKQTPNTICLRIENRQPLPVGVSFYSVKTTRTFTLQSATQVAKRVSFVPTTLLDQKQAPHNSFTFSAAQRPVADPGQTLVMMVEFRDADQHINAWLSRSVDNTDQAYVIHADAILLDPSFRKTDNVCQYVTPE